MGTKHTPGPWREGSHRTIESANGTICEVYSHMGIAEADANQHLIAAAPELLEALDQAANGRYLDGIPNHDDDSLRSIAHVLPDGWARTALLRHAARIDTAIAKAAGSHA